MAPLPLRRLVLPIMLPHNNERQYDFMKQITLTASEVIDGKRVELGKQENFPVPETVDEVIGMSDRDDGCSDNEIVSCFVYGWKVMKQRQLRSGADPKKPVTIFKKTSETKQNEILELARKAGLL